MEEGKKIQGVKQTTSQGTVDFIGESKVQGPEPTAHVAQI